MALVGGESVDAPGRASAKDTHVGNATLFRLPVELQKMILEYCSTNADKKNVCVSSKRLQVLMTPLLYRRMELSDAQLTNGFLRTLESSHPGLSYVRVLSIRFFAKAQINTLCRLIFALPKNILTRFEIPTFYLSCLGIHCALHLRQKGIANYQYGGVHQSEQDEIHKTIWRNLAPRGDELSHITTLQVLITSMSDIERVARIFKHTPALQGLDLESVLSRYGSRTHLTCCEIDAEIFKGLFTSCANARYHARLKKLRIGLMCLKHSGKLLPSLLNLEGLETLQLVECDEIGSIIEHLTQLQLHLYSVYIDRGCDGPCDDAAISDFLASLAAPKRISLLCEVEYCEADYPYDGQIDVDRLQKHAQSVEYLRLEDNSATCLTYGLSDQKPQFCSFFEHASNLKQLSLSGPELDDETEVAEFLDIIRPLSALSILKTQMFFVEKDAPNPNIPFAARLVEQTANKIFNMAFPKLAAMVIKVSGLPSKIFDDETFAFLRSERVGPDGKKTYMAVEIEPHMIKHHVACADILEEERFVFA